MVGIWNKIKNLLVDYWSIFTGIGDICGGYEVTSNGYDGGSSSWKMAMN